MPCHCNYIDSLAILNQPLFGSITLSSSGYYLSQGFVLALQPTKAPDLLRACEVNYIPPPSLQTSQCGIVSSKFCCPPLLESLTATPSFPLCPAQQLQEESLVWPIQHMEHRVAPPAVAAEALADSAVQMQLRESTSRIARLNRHQDSDSDDSNDSFDLFAPFKPPAPAPAASEEVEVVGDAAPSKADSEEGETAPVQDWTDSNSHDSDEINAGDCSDGPPDSPAQLRTM